MTQDQPSLEEIIHELQRDGSFSPDDEALLNEKLKSIKNYTVGSYGLQVVDASSGEVLYDKEFQNIDLLKEQVNVFYRDLCKERQPVTLDEAMRLYALTKELPSVALLQQAVTEVQKNTGTYLRVLAQLVGGCFFYRSQKMPGDPIRDLLAVDVSEAALLHTAVWSAVGVFDVLHQLIHLLWEPISLELSSLSDAPASSFDLLLELIREHFDYFCSLCLLEEKLRNTREQEELATAIRTYLTTPHLLKPKQKKILENENNLKAPFWLSTVLGIAERDFKTHGNQTAKSLLSIYRYQLGGYFEHVAKYNRKARKGSRLKTNTERKF